MATNDPWYWRTGSEEIDPLQQQSAQLAAAKQRLQPPQDSGSAMVTQPPVQQADMGGQSVSSFTVNQRTANPQADPKTMAWLNKSFKTAVKTHQKMDKKVVPKQIAAAEARARAIDVARNPGRVQPPTQPQQPMTNLQRMTQDSIAHGWNGVIPKTKPPSSLLSQG
jgi:hypothetical protein